eukprot:12708059-Heterocapsa_arctica.AAC.1
MRLTSAFNYLTARSRRTTSLMRWFCRARVTKTATTTTSATQTCCSTAAPFLRPLVSRYSRL